MSEMNRLHNSSNPYQGDYKRVLCVCSAGLLRSPTAAVVLAGAPFNYNTRAAGLDTEHALIPVDDVLLVWADEIVCMTEEQRERLVARTDKPIINLSVPDSFGYRDKRLVKMIKDTYIRLTSEAPNAKTPNREASGSERATDSDQDESEGC